MAAAATIKSYKGFPEGNIDERTLEALESVTAELVAGTASDIHAIKWDNSNNSANTYLKFYDAVAPASGVSPDLQILCPGSGKGRMTTTVELFSWATAIDLHANTAKEDTSTTDPTSAFDVSVMFDNT